MRTLLLIALLGLAGCQTAAGPLAPRRPERADDPLLCTAEQKRKARYLFAFPDEELGPQSRGERPPLTPID